MRNTLLKVQATETLAMSLEQTVRVAERERQEEQRGRNRLEQEMAERTSLYEAR